VDGVLREIFVLLGVKTDDKGVAKGMLAVEELKEGAELVVEAFKKAGEALYEALVETGKAAEQFANLEQRTGIASQTLQGYAAIASAAGVDSEAFTTGLRTLSMQMEKAADGSSEAQALFQKLGVRTRDVTGKMRPLEDVLSDVTDGLAGMEDGAHKSALAQEALGRGGGQLIPILNKGSEALKEEMKHLEDIGVIMSKGMAKDATALDDAFDEVGHSLEGLKNTIVGPLLKPVKELVDLFSQWVQANRKMIASAIVRVVRVLGVALSFVLRVAEPLVTFMLKLADTSVGAALIIGTLVAGLALMAAGFIGAAAAALPLAAEMIAAGLPVMGLVLAFMALIGVLGLFAEDIYGYFHGKKSVFGEFIEALKEMGDEVGTKMKGWFTSAIEFWKTSFTEFITWLLANFDRLPGPLKWLAKAAGASALQSAGEAVQGAGLVAGLFSGGPSTSTSSSASTSLRANFVIQTTPGMDNASVGTAVREHLDDWWNQKVDSAFDSAVGQYTPVPGGG
jgi:hypothetical protein